MTKRMTMKQFCLLHKIRVVRCRMVDANPNAPDWEDANHYRVTLGRGTRRMTIYFSMGYAHTQEPRAEDVMEYMACESVGVEHVAGDFDSWSRDFGFDVDSRKEERTWRRCVAQAEKLKKFLGEDLYQVALWEVEG